MMYFKFTKKTMPPLNARILIWMDCRSTDGGFPVIGRYCQYNSEEPYIRYITPRGWRRLEEYDKRNALWQPIGAPEEISAKMGKGAQNG